LQKISDTIFAAIDFESAGTASGQTDVPIQIGIALWSPSTGYGETFCSFLHTDRPITWSAQKVHGISTEDLKDAPTLLSLWPEIRRLLGGHAIVAHGHGTEKRFLRTFPGHPVSPWIDTLLLSRAAWPETTGHGLGDLCKKLELADHVRERSPDRNWHDALFDSIGSLALLECLLEEQQWHDQPLDLLLHPDLRRYHRNKQ
jgi:DNA polymerase-3 subunit epsilon